MTCGWHPAASAHVASPSTGVVLVALLRMSSLHFLPNTSSQLIQRLLSHPRDLHFISFSTSFYKRISLIAPQATPSQSGGLARPACSAAESPAPCSIPVLGFDSVSAFASGSKAEQSSPRLR